MGSGDPKRRPVRCSLWLCLLLLWAGALQAAGIELSELRDDPPAVEVLAGRHDARVELAASNVIQQPDRQVQWWRVRAASAPDRGSSPQLVLAAPFLYSVQAWVPGATGPSRHALYGPDADPRYSHRALVIALPQGLPAGEAVWLRVERSSTQPMRVSIESLDDVHRTDLAYVAWRAGVLSTLAMLVLLGLAFWGGTGERSYAYFTATLVCAIGYLSAVSGDLRWLPGADALFGHSPQTNRVIGCLGVVFSNLFQRGYLDLPRKLPLLDRGLSVLTLVALATAALSLPFDSRLLSHAGNLSLLTSAALLLAASAFLALRGDRPGRVVLVSWIPLMVFSFLAAVRMIGLWEGPEWLSEGLAGSFVLASLLLAIGLSDKLLQLRRDRDQASRQATIDPVTKALNRHGIEERLYREAEAARESQSPLSIAMVDVDHFKEINDRHGHAIGDQCLRIVAWRLHGVLGRSDRLGRYGGDEFLLVMPGQGAEAALALAERMRVSVNCRPLTMPDADVRASLSIGVAELAPGESLSSLFERADAALYASKSAGRDRVTPATPHQGLWTH